MDDVTPFFPLATCYPCGLARSPCSQEPAPSSCPCRAVVRVGCQPDRSCDMLSNTRGILPGDANIDDNGLLAKYGCVHLAKRKWGTVTASQWLLGTASFRLGSPIDVKSFRPRAGKKLPRPIGFHPSTPVALLKLQYVHTLTRNSWP